MNETILKDIRHTYNKDERICDWSFIEIFNKRIRVYYKPNEEIGLGFDFYAVENIGGYCTDEYKKDKWSINSCFIQCLFTGIARFDGIRHLYMGDDVTNNFGYHYYANIEGNIETLRVIRELEKKYCRDYQEKYNN